MQLQTPFQFTQSEIANQLKNDKEKVLQLDAVEFKQCYRASQTQMNLQRTSVSYGQKRKVNCLIAV